MTTFKKLEVGKKTSKIIFEHPDTEYTYSVERRLRAISILTGAYNLYGRKIDVEKYTDLQNEFEKLVHEIELNME